jgi:hypothetical protein
LIVTADFKKRPEPEQVVVPETAEKWIVVEGTNLDELFALARSAKSMRIHGVSSVSQSDPQAFCGPR